MRAQHLPVKLEGSFGQAFEFNFDIGKGFSERGESDFSETIFVCMLDN